MSVSPLHETAADVSRALELRDHVVGLGDSHMNVIRAAKLLFKLPSTVEMITVPGATAQGLVNPNSRTDALRRFQRRCEKANKSETLVFLLGEVDCGFLIWYRAEKHGVSIESQLQRSLDAYVALLGRQTRRGLSTLVLSAPPPTIRDGQDWGKVRNERSSVNASQRDRTELTLEYNERLCSASSRIGAVFLDVTTPTLDRETGLIKSSFLNLRPTDYHLHFIRYAEIVGPAIALALEDPSMAARRYAWPKLSS